MKTEKRFQAWSCGLIRKLTAGASPPVIAKSSATTRRHGRVAQERVEPRGAPVRTALSRSDAEEHDEPDAAHEPEGRERGLRDADLLLVALLQVGQRLEPVVAHGQHQLKRPEAEDLGLEGEALDCRVRALASAVDDRRSEADDERRDDRRAQDGRRRERAEAAPRERRRAPPRRRAGRA